MGINIGDIIFQLISFIVLGFIILFIVSFFRSLKYRFSQLDRVEKKLDEVLEQQRKEH